MDMPLGKLRISPAELRHVCLIYWNPGLRLPRQWLKRRLVLPGLPSSAISQSLRNAALFEKLLGKVATGCGAQLWRFPSKHGSERHVRVSDLFSIIELVHASPRGNKKDIWTALISVKLHRTL